MVCATVNPNLRAASCCKVDVVKGAAGLFFSGRVEMSWMVKEADRQLSRNFWASALVLIRRDSSAFISTGLPSASGTRNTAVTRYDASDWKACISRSRSTIRRTATDCTRPAESAGFTFFHNTGESSKPTIRSRIRRACWASTRLMSILRGCSMAFRMALWVISWKTIRLVCSGCSFSTSYKCHAIASPSRSSSDANHTVSASLASAFNSSTTFFLSPGIS